MSTSGIYNYHPKVMHPNKIYHQMDSNAIQPMFYFGGSQVPENLNISTGSGVHTKYKSHVTQMKELDAQGRGIKTTMQKHHKIYLPKHMSTLTR